MNPSGGENFVRQTELNKPQFKFAVLKFATQASLSTRAVKLSIARHSPVSLSEVVLFHFSYNLRFHALKTERF